MLLGPNYNTLMKSSYTRPELEIWQRLDATQVELHDTSTVHHVSTTGVVVAQEELVANTPAKTRRLKTSSCRAAAQKNSLSCQLIILRHVQLQGQPLSLLTNQEVNSSQNTSHQT